MVCLVLLEQRKEKRNSHGNVSKKTGPSYRTRLKRQLYSRQNVADIEIYLIFLNEQTLCMMMCGSKLDVRMINDGKVVDHMMQFGNSRWNRMKSIESLIGGGTMGEMLFSKHYWY